MTLRKDPQRGQFDLFSPYLSDMPLRDQRETMERPFFSLSKASAWLTVITLHIPL